ncbi:MAG TPA: DUF4252 domain-containing protein [Blastocatellia bacterium]|jgi:hypothetical protein|nr:DUF4252 domain-containing protein [Blastocatellia bacterium]
MKTLIPNLRRLPGFCLLALFAVIPASAQQGKIHIDHLERLATRAVETVDVTVDDKLITLAWKFLGERSPDEKLVKDIIKDLKGVFVKRFVFEKESEYTDADVETIRSQLNAPGWSKVVGVRSRRQGANVDVHIMTEESLIKGLAVLVAEPKALTVVNIVGPIDVEKLSQLGGRFGIPILDLERMGTTTKVKEKETKP